MKKKEKKQAKKVVAITKNKGKISKPLEKSTTIPVKKIPAKVSLVKDTPDKKKTKSLVNSKSAVLNMNTKASKTSISKDKIKGSSTVSKNAKKPLPSKSIKAISKTVATGIAKKSSASKPKKSLSKSGTAKKNTSPVKKPLAKGSKVQTKKVDAKKTSSIVTKAEVKKSISPKNNGKIKIAVINKKPTVAKIVKSTPKVLPKKAVNTKTKTKTKTTKSLPVKEISKEITSAKTELKKKSAESKSSKPSKNITAQKDNAVVDKVTKPKPIASTPKTKNKGKKVEEEAVILEDVDIVLEAPVKKTVLHKLEIKKNTPAKEGKGKAPATPPRELWRPDYSNSSPSIDKYTFVNVNKPEPIKIESGTPSGKLVKFESKKADVKKSTLKAELVNKCLEILNKSVAISKKEMDDAQESANEEKGSTEEKFDSFRESMQTARDMFARQYSEGVNSVSLVNRINPKMEQNVVILGSVVKTDLMNYFVSVSVGEIVVGKEKFIAISTQTPLCQAIFGKKKGDTFKLMNKTYTIKEVF